MNPSWKVRLWTAVALVVIVPLGLATKRYPIEGLAWVQENSGGALYVVFFCLAALLVWPRARIWIIALAVLAATCGVEVLQLWHPPWLEAIRDTTPGALVLGSTFVWADFPFYFIGAALGWGLMWMLTRPLRPRSRLEASSRG